MSDIIELKEDQRVIKLRDPEFKPASLEEIGTKNIEEIENAMWNNILSRLTDLENAEATRNYSEEG